LLLSGPESALEGFEQVMNGPLGKQFGVESFRLADGTITAGRLLLHHTSSKAEALPVTDLLNDYRARNPLDWNGVPLVFKTYIYDPIMVDEPSWPGQNPRQTPAGGNTANTLHEASTLTPTLLAGRINDWLSQLDADNDPRAAQFQSLEACANPLLDHAEAWPIWQADSDNGSGSGGPLLSEPPIGVQAERGGLAQVNARLLKRIRLDEAAPNDGQGVTVVILDTAPVRENGSVDGRAIDPQLVDFWCDVQTVPITTAKRDAPKPDPSCRCMRQDTASTFGSNGRTPEQIDQARSFGKEYHGMFAASLVKMIAPQASVLLLRVLNSDAIGDAADIMRAINLAMALRKDKTTAGNRRVVEDKVIFNLSLGLSRTLSEEEEPCAMLRVIEAAAYESAVFVAAAGNDSWPCHPRNPEEPAAYGYYADGEYSCRMMICVAATDERESTKIAYFSNQGVIGAPAQHIFMETGNPGKREYTRPGADRSLRAPAFVEWSGTSFAAPLVAGAAARLLSGDTTAEKIKETLWETSAKPARWDGIAELRLV
jgi:subtilisin family serine protease